MWGTAAPGAKVEVEFGGACVAAKAGEDLSFIEVKCAIGARDDLGRPTTTALENKRNFMAYLETL